MKHFLTNFTKFFFGNPIFPTLAAICSIFAVFFTADTLVKPQGETPVSAYKITALQMRASTTASDLVAETTALTTSAGTTAISTTTADVQTTAVPETKPPKEKEQAEEPVKEYQPPVYNYISAGESPNSSFYQDRLVIIGDSIAYGFNAYGYIPNEHNIAAESLAVWNMGNYSFDLGGGSWAFTMRQDMLIPLFITYPSV